MAGEIADGWIPLFFAPSAMNDFAAQLSEGFARPGARRTSDEFEILALCPVLVADDIERAADLYRPTIALYAGGMGAREVNFHYDVFCRLGFEAEAAKIQELYLDGRKDEAAAAVPTKMVEAISLIGPREKIRDDLEAWRESIATTLLVSGDATTLRTIAELVG
jgi:alkanesulfonate monooxygenase SsuD/methylene tetrahydromethanopterin reductase-like flavin-dependent oxidoreductase (luciferase family)